MTEDAHAQDAHARLLALADELHDRVLSREPFGATMFGLPGHDREVPDPRAEAAASYRAVLLALQERVEGLPAPTLPADVITLACVREMLAGELTGLDAATVEHTVTPMFGEGPSALFTVASMTSLADATAAQDHLVRVAAYAEYLDRCVARLQDGASRGRTPVATLVEVTLRQLDGYLVGDGAASDPIASVAPPEGWDGGAEWSAALAALVTDSVRPAVARYRAAVAALPTRPDEQCGLVHLAGGLEDYARLVRLHTTLPLTAQEVHDVGRDVLAGIVAQMTALGATLGLDGFPAVLAAARESASQVTAEQAMAAAREAVERAEALVADWFPAPLPPPCLVEPMSEHLGGSGAPPHYSPPSLDGSRRGTYWFNAQVLGAGSGWDLEATAYHEAVPGHHLQFTRLQARPELPALQAQSMVTAHAEGWGLYAEEPAGEMGLYSSDQARLGSLVAQSFRAARLVVDTGIHALGWSRLEAVEFLQAHAALPDAFLVSEVNRYIAMPGQALAYMTGKREVMRLRAVAEERLGDRFDVRGFHGALLDSGALPLPALGVAVDTWVEGVLAG